MKRWLSLILVLAAASSFAQFGTPREKEIWRNAYSRMSAQNEEWFHEGDYPRLVQLLTIMVELFPFDFDAVSTLGWMQENIDRYDLAIATYVRFRERNPNHPDAYYPEGEFYFRVRQYGKVIQVLDPVYKRHPDPNTLRILAHAYEKLNLYKDAKRVYDFYVTAFPNDATAKMNREKAIKRLEAGAPTAGK